MTIERVFDDAQDSGHLKLHMKGLKKLPLCVEDYDLLDVLTVDISRNRFTEIPEEVLEYAMMETLNCSRNFIKTLPDMGTLNSLTHINISQNQLHTLPVILCQLPLKIIKASHNRITVVPSDIGALSRLQLLDLSCNELTKLPSTIGDLVALRSLDIHRNNIVALPDELSKLKNLQRLDFSSNKVSVIPPAFRLIQSLVRLNLKDNPLTSPPAKVCMKGRIHLIKYLGTIAQQEEKRWTIPTEALLNRSPSLSTASNNSKTEINHVLDSEPMKIEPDLIEHQETIHEDVDEEIELVPSHENVNGSVKNGSVNCGDDNKSQKGGSKMRLDLVLPDHEIKQQQEVSVEKSVSEKGLSPGEEKPTLPPKPTMLYVTANNTADVSEKQKLPPQEKGKLTPHHRTPVSTPTSTKTFGSRPEDFSLSESMSLDRRMFRDSGSGPNRISEWESTLRYEKKHTTNTTPEENLDDIAVRKEQLMKNKEEILESKQRLENLKSKTMSLPHTAENDIPFEGIKKRSTLAAKQNKKFLDGASNYTMRRFYDSAKEEFVELEKLRGVIEEKLRIKLPDDLPASLSDGIVLCHFVNHLRKGTIPAIHVPSSGVPKLTMPKCQMNVDAFLDACRKIGVNKIDICAPPDILEEKNPTNLCRTVSALLVALAVNSTNSLSPR